MHLLRIGPISLNQALEFKNTLITDDLTIDEDFTWRWLPYFRYSDPTVKSSTCVEFRFANPAVATFYQLKWL